MLNLDRLDRQLLDNFQKEFPLSPEPYREMAEQLGSDERTVIERLQTLINMGLVSRIGPVFKVNCVGISTLAAMSVPPDRITEVAELINEFTEVNHNYEREDEFNLWFVITARNTAELDLVVDAMEKKTGLDILRLPMEEDYHIDLGFKLRWR